ncbi:MAG: trehalase, partial [Cytophagaceae bacterium]
QPPFFSLMVELLAQKRGHEIYVKYLPQLVKEYYFWMDGAGGHHVVKLKDGMLNRYYDEGDYPRDESYREDVLEARKSKQDNRAFYRNIRSAAESGWDFSSRWFADGEHLSTIQTTDIIPVDLNCLLYNLERVIEKGYAIKGDQKQSDIAVTPR